MSLPPPPQQQPPYQQQPQYPQQPQYQQPQYYAPPVQAAGPAPGVSYAGFLVRFIAYVIDGFIQGLIVWAFILLGGVVAAGGAATGSNAATGTGVGIGLILLLVGLAIALLWKPWWWSHGGQTPAYKILHLRVVRARDGGPIGLGTGILRLIGYIINDIVFGIPLGFIWAGFDNAKQGWHDKIAGTVVIVQP